MQTEGSAKRIASWAAVVGFVMVIGPTAAALRWNSLERKDLVPNERPAEKVWWRVRLFARKATGDVPDLSWTELWDMAQHRGGFGLERLVMGVGEDGAVVNPYRTPEDIKAGAHIFIKRCVMCHGTDAVGGNAPALNRAGLKHGDSNLAIYKDLRDGIPGTPMVSPGLSPTERWQVVDYLTHLMIHGSGPEAEVQSRLKINVSSEQVRAAGSKTDEWITYSGSVDGRRYTPLAQITPANVSQLRIQWIQQLDTSDLTVEATPLVSGGTIFITEPPASVIAIDTKSGNVIWRYDRSVATDLLLCCGRRNRGLALLGQTLFLNTLDGYLVAIDANTGKMIWETRVAEPSDGYSMTGAPLIVNRSVVVGVAGGEYGIRGFVASYDPVTGEQQWKFNTIPDPGEPGHETWQSDRWEAGGGPTWVTGSYDPSLDLLYWGVGNPSGDYSGDNRPGDNLYTNSAIALHASTGKLAWYFQFTPHDEHDWDSAQTPILTDIVINGAKRKVICWPNRNGFYYVLDRVTGEFLTGVPFVEQNWAKGLDSKGRPIPTDANSASVAGTLTKPSSAGATNFQNPAMDQTRGMIFVPATEGSSLFTKAAKVRATEDRSLLLSLSSSATTPEAITAVVRALDIATGSKKWEYFSPPLKTDLPYFYSGLLSTGGGLVFGAPGGYVFAVDSSTGHEAWRMFLGGDTHAPPISFTVDGKQVIAVSVGRSLFMFGL